MGGKDTEEDEHGRNQEAGVAALVVAPCPTSEDGQSPSHPS